MATGKCCSCGEVGALESVSVRVYFKRTQVSYLYRVCQNDKMVLLTFLEGPALSTTRGLFDPPMDIDAERARAAKLAKAEVARGIVLPNATAKRS